MPASTPPGAWPGGVSELLAALVQVPSVHPDGDPGTGPENIGEGRIAQFVGQLLEQLGAGLQFDDVLPDRPNVIGKFPSDRSGKPRIVFAPHLDTVTVAGMTIDPFAGGIREGRLYGRGASDTKGTMAAMLQALCEMGAEAIAQLPVEVHFAGLMSEESGQLGSKDFGRRYGGDYAIAIVGEPTELGVVHTHKGCTWSRLTTSGKAAHASIPEAGKSAVTAMAEVVLALDGPFRKALAEAADEDRWLGVSTVNIGMIEGGVRANVVPDRCSAVVDIRSTPGLIEAGGALEFMTGWLKENFPEIEIGAEVIAEAHPLPLQAGPYVDALAAAGTGRTGAPWFCDAAFLSEAGIPAVAAGPGSITQAHTADEWIDLGALEEGVAFYRRFLESLSSAAAAS